MEARSIRGGMRPPPPEFGVCGLRREGFLASALRSSPAGLVWAGAVTLGLWFLGCGAPHGEVTERVLLVTIDTLRADRLGCYGSESARTPVIDTLAASGVRFAAAISPAPLTLPAHASLMTALDPPGHAVRHNSIHRLSEDVPTLAESMREAGFATAAFVGALVLDRRFGLDRGFDVYDDAIGSASSKTVGYAERSAEAVVDAALRWLESAPPRFFLWVHLYDPHAPYAPPPGFAAAFASDPYAGEIAYADHQLGRLLDGIDARFGSAGRLVVVTSDHGEGLGEHREETHAYGIYDATQRVPLVFSGAGVPPGRVVDAPVRLVDVAPTVLAVVAAPPLSGVGGRDLSPQLGGDPGVPEPAYVETLATHFDYGWSPLVGLRTERFKYIRAPRPELYDLQADPHETRDLARERPEDVARLDAQLEARLPARQSVAVDLGEEDRERLRSLGYVVPEGRAMSLRADRLGGPDPKDEIDLLARVARAEALALAGRPAEALAPLAALSDPPTHVRLLRSAIRVETGEWSLAAEDARSVVAASPRRVDARLLLAAALEGGGDVAGARAAFEAALALDRRSVAAWRGLARTAELEGDAAAADRARSWLEGAGEGVE